jgi:hypothetical protein
MYHQAFKANHQSILNKGLLISCDKTGHGGIFMSTHQPADNIGSDIWAIETQSLNLEEDMNCPLEAFEDKGEQWYCCYDNICPTRLSLVTKTLPQDTKDTIKRISQAIHATIKEFFDEHQVTPWDINNGLCGEFADDVETKLNLPSEQLFSLEFANITNSEDDIWTDFYPLAIEPYHIRATHGLDKKTILNALIPHMDMSHVWIIFKCDDICLHFDAENPEGVNNPLLLTVVDKFIRAAKLGIIDNEPALDHFLSQHCQLSRQLFKATLGENAYDQLLLLLEKAHIPTLISCPDNADQAKQNDVERAQALGKRQGLKLATQTIANSMQGIKS